MITASLTVRFMPSEDVNQHLLTISELHTRAMAEAPWNETWSNDLSGTDPRADSPAMFKKLLAQEADFVSARSNETIIGLGVGLVLRSDYLQSMEWGNATCYSCPKPHEGDYEMNLVLVKPECRGQGIMAQLAEARLELAKQKCRKGSRIWVQTRPANDSSICTSHVLNFYRQRGFEEVGQMVIKGTERVFLAKKIC